MKNQERLKENRRAKVGAGDGDRTRDIKLLITSTRATSAGIAAAQKSELEVSVRVDEAIPERLVGDGAKIGQVIANLMMNAVKFTDRGFVALVVSLRDAMNDAVTLEAMVSDTGGRQRFVISLPRRVSGSTKRKGRSLTLRARDAQLRSIRNPGSVLSLSESTTPSSGVRPRLTMM